MRLPSMLLACAAVLAAGCAHRSPAPGQPLFNGRNLEGWVIMHGGEWTVADGILTGRNGVGWTTNPETSGSWLRTAREYGDFVLDLDYTINAKGNSGVFIRAALDKNPAFTGNEMQILDDSQMTEPKTWSTGALYDVVAANRVMSKPAGEWNTVRIEARGPRVRIWLNGAEIALGG